MKTKFLSVLSVAGALFALSGCNGTNNAFLSSAKQETEGLASASTAQADQRAGDLEDERGEIKRVNISVKVNVYTGGKKGKRRARRGRGRRGASKDDAANGAVIALKKASAADTDKEKKPEEEAAPAGADGESQAKGGGEPAKAEKPEAEEPGDSAETTAKTEEESAGEEDRAQAESAVRKAAAATEPQVKTDILFYLGFKGDGSCWERLSLSVQQDGFFAHIEDDVDWRAAAAFQADDPELYFFRKPPRGFVNSGGAFSSKKVYALNKGQFPAEASDLYLQETLQAEYLRDVISEEFDSKGQKYYGEAQFPLGKKPPSDPLAGLDRLLDENPEKFRREGVQTLVVLLEFDNYFYTENQWREFENKHKTVQLAALNSFRGTGANHPFKLKKSLLSCDSPDIAYQLAERVKASAEK